MKSKSFAMRAVLGRRAFLTGGAVLGASAAAGLVSSAAADTYGGEIPCRAGEAHAPPVAAPGFLHAEERETGRSGFVDTHNFPFTNQTAGEARLLDRLTTRTIR